MNELTIVNQNGQLLADSRDVASLIDKRHDHLIRDIEGYSAVLDQTPDLGADQYFIASTYQVGTGKNYKRYLLTRKGCEFVANKMTGDKGIRFTAEYVSKFQEMEQIISNNAPISEKEQLLATMRLSMMHDEELKGIRSNITALETKVDNMVTLTAGQQRLLQKEVSKRVATLLESLDERHLQLVALSPERDKAKRKLYSQLHRAIKDSFAVPSYRDIRTQDYQEAVNFIKAWRPRLVA
ncbi:hypothetical protein G4V62_13905 [Bacillaceae bacterium SIJ1]|uniref:Rha family transcriptional regulator n=1 Tax=Litoribacterium kuwaitense TaxID=1398745 RepID=UPI0013ED47F4|nr:Rha family transcriptional regulator [Litoribacterium kuwaitense]NGP45989.1 hypothetical protein [Litoribacterium kuwaitense]